MAMGGESFVARWPRRPKPREILATLSITRIADFFVSDPPMLLPPSAPVGDDISELERHQLETQLLPKRPYRERVKKTKRPEEVMDTVHIHIWNAVNAHLGTTRPF